MKVKIVITLLYISNEEETCFSNVDSEIDKAEGKKIY